MGGLLWGAPGQWQDRAVRHLSSGGSVRVGGR